MQQTSVSLAYAQAYIILHAVQGYFISSTSAGLRHRCVDKNKVLTIWYVIATLCKHTDIDITVLLYLCVNNDETKHRIPNV